MTFENLNIIAPITRAIKQKGYTEPTPIQVKVIPEFLNGADVFGTAQTGTGKTAAFAIPILQNLSLSQHNSRNSGIRALIVAPTRELAIQISDSFSNYGRGLGLKHTVVYGGVSQLPQTTILRKGVDILIATPGRLLDLMNQGFIRLDRVKFFILDEADRMLDMGFAPDIKRIIAKLPARRQTGFFTATIPPEIRALANSLLNNPVMINAVPASTPAEGISQWLYYVERAGKKALLHHVLQSEDVETVLVFTRTKHGANRVAKDLNKIGITAEAIHGNKSQLARQRALTGFKNRTIKVLVATDIASRGIDVDKLSHVINYELPEVPETYIHRIGRTARAGARGTAISFCSADERGNLKGINKLLPASIEVKPTDDLAPAETTADRQPANAPAHQNPNREETRNHSSQNRRRFHRKRY